MADVTTMQTLRAAAANALASGDYASAILKARQALAYVPADGGHAGTTMSYANVRQSLLDIITQAQAERTRTSGGMQRRRIRYVNPGECE